MAHVAAYPSCRSHGVLWTGRIKTAVIYLCMLPFSLVYSLFGSELMFSMMKALSLQWRCKVARGISYLQNASCP